MLGPVARPDWETMAALVGTVDGKRVARLVRYAEQQGLIEVSENRKYLHLAPAAWSRPESLFESWQQG
jgi:hypothetical protein